MKLRNQAKVRRIVDANGLPVTNSHRIAGDLRALHGPTLYQSRLLNTRRLGLVSAKSLSNGAVAMHYRRARGQRQRSAKSIR